MCNDDKFEHGTAGEVLARLQGPGVMRALDDFITHMRKVIPDFAEGTDRAMLRVVFVAGRRMALEYMREHAEVVDDANTHMMAAFLAEYSEERGISVEVMEKNLDQRDKESQHE